MGRVARGRRRQGPSLKHVPHVLVGAPWPDGDLPVSIVQWRHLTKVLRKNRGDPVTYTDGLGRIGEGRLGSQTIVRGEEATMPRPSEITVVVAPPANKDRARFLVEKLAEMGVARLRWLESRHGEGRVPSSPKVFSWVMAATEQSRGAWLMETSTEAVTFESLGPEIAVCDASGAEETPELGVVVIGPEGGWAEGEVPSGVTRWRLGPTVLRTETAAVVAAARLVG